MISLNTGDKVRVHPLTYDSEVLVEQSHVDRQQLRQSDGQTAAQTDVRVSGVHYVQHWQRREIQRQKRFNTKVILSYFDWTNHVISSYLSDARVWRRSLPTRSRWHQWRAADSRWAQTLETCREPQTATRPVSPPPPQTDVDTWRKKRKEYELELIKKRHRKNCNVLSSEHHQRISGSSFHFQMSTLSQRFWFCPELNYFWQSIFKT